MTQLNNGQRARGMRWFHALVVACLCGGAFFGAVSGTVSASAEPMIEDRGDDDCETEDGTLACAVEWTEYYLCILEGLEICVTPCCEL